MHPLRQEPSRVEASRETLVRRMAAGDQSAMAELYDQTSPRVFGLALRIVGDHAAAADVVLEVYAQAWKQAPSFDPSRGSPSAWLLNLARSRAIDLRRARRRDQASEPLEAGALHHGVRTAPGCLFIATASERNQLLG